MQRIERTRMLSEELQQLVKTSMGDKDWESTDESDAVAETLYSIFLTKDRRKLMANGRPEVNIYLQMLECPPESRREMIDGETDEALRKKLAIAEDDLARLTGADDFRLEGAADLFDFGWAVPLVVQKKSKSGDDTGGVKVQQLKNRQQLLDLCLRIRPALSLAQANRFLTHVMRSAPVRHRSPIDAIYYFALFSGDELGGFDAQRAFIRDALGRMAEYYQQAEKSGEPQTAESQRLFKEKQTMEMQRLREEEAAAKKKDAEKTAALNKELSDAKALHRNKEISDKEFNTISYRIKQEKAELKRLQQERTTRRQNEEQRMAEERARQRMIETATISMQFSDVEPGDTEEFMQRYLGELPQMDLLGNHYSARRHLRENLEAVGVHIYHDEESFADDRVIKGRRKTEHKNELYQVRLAGAQTACAHVVEEMLLPAWNKIGYDFLLSCDAVLPADFPDRARLMQRFEQSVLEETERREAPSLDTVRKEIHMHPLYYGPFFFRSLRRYHEKADKDNQIRQRIRRLQDAQARFCSLMEDDNIFQFITSDYNYECIVGSNKKSWPKEEPSALKSSRLEKITAKATKTFALNRNDVDDVPRSLLLLTELARIDRHLTDNPEQHVNATLIRCGYPGLYARRKLDQFALTMFACLRQRQTQSDGELSVQDVSSGIVAGLHSFLQLWLMEPVARFNRKLNVKNAPEVKPEEVRAKPRNPKDKRS